MSRFDSSKDYYSILGAEADATPGELERLYKRRAVEHHPDRGGDEEDMKALNEAYGVLKDDETRSAYDAERRQPFDSYVEPYASPSAVADEISGRSVEALLCLFAGVVLLIIVRAHWMRFLWPLGILAVFVIVAGVMLAHSVMLAIRGSVESSHPARRYIGAQEALFWSLVCVCAYALYVLLVNL